MKEGGKEGGNTVTGLNFESKVDFLTLLENTPDYSILSNSNAGRDIYYSEERVARCFKKNTSFIVFLMR